MWPCELGEVRMEAMDVDLAKEVDRLMLEEMKRE